MLIIKQALVLEKAQNTLIEKRLSHRATAD